MNNSILYYSYYEFITRLMSQSRPLGLISMQNAHHSGGSPKRGAGAGVGVGMLMGVGGFPYMEVKIKVPQFQFFKFSKFQSFNVQSFKVPKIKKPFQICDRHRSQIQEFREVSRRCFRIVLTLSFPKNKTFGFRNYPK